MQEKAAGPGAPRNPTPVPDGIISVLLVKWLAVYTGSSKKRKKEKEKERKKLNCFLACAEYAVMSSSQWLLHSGG